jgi:adenylosuccinate lyase
MNNHTSYDQFVSPFSWRYGSTDMRTVWSEVYKRRAWRRIWVALARAQETVGLVTTRQVAELEANADRIDMERALEIERRIHHDLMAEVQTYAEICPHAGRIIHLGATSADIKDNADVLLIRDSLNLVLGKLREILLLMSEKIQQLADHVVMAFTHIQPAEPTTMGYRLALYAQDLLEDYHMLSATWKTLRGKGMKGAVGTAASYMQLLEGTGMSPAELERLVMDELELTAFPIAAQTYPRKQDYEVLSNLAGLAASIHKFAFDLRLLQSPVIGEWHEPFGSSQVGSSAMPFKRNPIHSETLNSLSRLVAAQAHVAWDNASQSLLERTLDDSANRREILPVAFLATDEMLMVLHRIIDGLRIDTTAAQRNLTQFGVFSAVERVLMDAVKAGADRQEIHEHLRQHSLAAWTAITAGQDNPLVELLVNSPELNLYLTPQQIRNLLDASVYVGDAPLRARNFAADIQLTLADA